jgi:hypothetical protein
MNQISNEFKRRKKQKSICIEFLIGGFSIFLRTTEYAIAHLMTLSLNEAFSIIVRHSRMTASNKLERQYKTVGVKRSVWLKAVYRAFRGMFEYNRTGGGGGSGMAESCRNLESEEFQKWYAYSSSSITVVNKSRRRRWMENAARME